jgi:hypothetical protein
MVLVRCVIYMTTPCGSPVRQPNMVAQCGDAGLCHRRRPGDGNRLARLFEPDDVVSEGVT